MHLGSDVGWYHLATPKILRMSGTRGAITEAVFAKPKYLGPQQPPAKW